jgi:magnesium chelatase family protein
MPADFMLVGAFNPIENNEDKDFTDNKYYFNTRINKYNKKISSALLDRIDILNYVPRLNYEEIENNKDSYNSEVMRENVFRARETQKERFKNTGYKYNSDLKGKDIFEICRVDKRCTDILKQYYNTSNVSLRGFGKVIKLSRTIADIDNKKDILEGHILEAFSYRKNINGEII